MTRRRTIGLVGVAMGLAAAWAAPRELLAQSQDRDFGHCVEGTRETVSCWNPLAGAEIPEDLSRYPEFLPNLRGWDFRVNLPYVRFQRLRSGPGSPVVMAGVVEDPRPMYSAGQANPSAVYFHRNNAIWMFRADTDGQIVFALLPSRADAVTGRPENARTLIGGWQRVGTAPGPGFTTNRVAVAVTGVGIGTATVHVAAQGRDGRIYHSQRRVDTATPLGWTSAWQDLGPAASAPSLAAVDASRVAVAFVDPGRSVVVRHLDPGAPAWSSPAVAGRQADPFPPRLVWDGVATNVLFSGGERLRHSLRLPAASTFTEPTTVSTLLPVNAGQFDVMAFNNGLHAVIRTRTGDPVGSGLFYTTTTTAPGGPSRWTIPSDVDMKADDAPRIAALAENVLVVVRTTSGLVASARKDPNSVDNRITGGALADRWLDAGQPVDASVAGTLGNLEVLAFNNDVYLTAACAIDSPTDSVIVNLGRAVVKSLFTGKWQMTLAHGERASNPVPFGPAGGVRLVGDFNNDRRTDIIRFPQKAEGGLGPAPAFVRLVNPPGSPTLFGDEAVWHRFFSLAGEIPLVGDFDGDRRSDIVTFVQKAQNFADGTPIGPAPVWVALSTGSSFTTSRIWHRFFSLKGEIPLTGDFNGDGKTDIVTFVQKAQNFADGTPIGPAPVWVALSTGTSFTTSRIWHRFFSLKGEIPMVGDFNGDGRDDIATFVGALQRNADGSVLGQAPVWVALSNGTTFEPSRVWHTFFSLKGERPMVADVDMDGKDDIVTFLQGRGPGLRKNNVFVAFSTGNRFDRSVTWASDQGGPTDTPFPGNSSGRVLSDLTQDAPDAAKPMQDFYVFEASGALRIATAMRMVPYPVGAPFERYRFFTDKGLGAAAFPEFIHATGPNRCLSSPFVFGLIGAAGVGGPTFMLSSVRPGGGQGHILEEQGHSLWANCLRANKDPFTMFARIFQTPLQNGGLDANNMPGCDTAFDDCRDPEHFFIGLMIDYRLNGDEFRSQILNGPVAARSRRRAQYLWFKQHWYRGAEFKRGPARDVSLRANGVLCLPGECAIDPPVFTPSVP